MSVQPNNTEPYCEPKHVARYFRTLEDTDGFAFDTNPSEEQVKDLIIENSARVDRETGHAWRERKVTEEYHDLDGVYYYWAGTPISLMKREIRTPMDASKGDKIEVFDGNQWEEWVGDSSYTEGRGNNGDYWVNSTDGILYVYRRTWFFERYQGIRVSYRYGAENIPKDVQQATAKLTAADLIRTDLFGDLLPAGTQDSVNPNDAAKQLEEAAMKALERRNEVRQF
jgi:hypothetical protein